MESPVRSGFTGYINIVTQERRPTRRAADPPSCQSQASVLTVGDQVGGGRLTPSRWAVLTTIIEQHSQSMLIVNSLTSKIALCFLGLAISLLAACQPPQSIAATPSIVPNVDQLLTPTPFMWPLTIQFDDANHPMRASVDTLLQLTPGVSTLQEMYNSIGYPRKRKDFSDSVALLYPSLWVKSPDVVILDGNSGKVMVVSIENVSTVSYTHLTLPTTPYV